MNNTLKLIKVKMTTVTPLFTGEIRREERENYQNTYKIGFPVRKTKTHKVIIPFKGALRASLEKLLRAKGTKVCDTGGSGQRPCGTCVVCSLFGSMGKKGRASVDFLISEDDKNMIVKTTTHIRINRETGSVSDSFKGEEVVEGATFRANIFIENPTDSDVQLIQSALRYIEEHGLGGWTTKGYGRVKFETEVVDVPLIRYIEG